MTPEDRAKKIKEALACAEDQYETFRLNLLLTDVQVMALKHELKLLEGS